MTVLNSSAGRVDAKGGAVWEGQTRVVMSSVSASRLHFLDVKHFLESSNLSLPLFICETQSILLLSWLWGCGVLCARPGFGSSWPHLPQLPPLELGLRFLPMKAGGFLHTSTHSSGLPLVWWFTRCRYNSSLSFSAANSMSAYLLLSPRAGLCKLVL